jgi:hypothetical protein
MTTPFPLAGKKPLLSFLSFEDCPEEAEEALLAALPADAQAYLARFSHALRRRQSLWGRALALAAARSMGALYSEDLPYGPVLLTPDGRKLAVSITHTDHYVGIGVPASSAAPLAVDLEKLPSDIPRFLAAAARRLPEKSFAALDRAAASTGSSAPWVAAWGIRECAVKMNRGQSRYSVLASKHAPWLRVADAERTLSSAVFWEPFAGGVYACVSTEGRPERCDFSPAALLEALGIAA